MAKKVFAELTTAQKDLAIKMYKSGIGVNTIALQLNCSLYQTHKIIKDEKLTRSRLEGISLAPHTKNILSQFEREIERVRCK